MNIIANDNFEACIEEIKNIIYSKDAQLKILIKKLERTVIAETGNPHYTADEETRKGYKD